MFLFWLMACTESEKPQDTTAPSESVSCADRTPSLIIGTGEFEWQDLADGDSLVMVHGPQGGWHLLGSILLQNTADIVEVEFLVTDIASNVVISSNFYRIKLLDGGECAGVYPGMYGYINVTPLQDGELDTPPELLGGNLLRIDMRANDCSEADDLYGECQRSQRWTSSSVEIIAELDPIDQ